MGYMNLWKDIKQRVDMIDFLFQKSYSGCHTYGGMEVKRDQSEDY